MPRRPVPEQPRPANLSAQQMQAAIPKLERRLTELRAMDVSTVEKRGDPRFDALEDKIDDTLVEIFGNDTVEYKRFRVGDMDTASINMFYETPLHEIREGYKRGLERAIASLQTVVDLFKEKLGDLGESPDGRAVRAFGNLEIHPEIERVVGKLFRDGHYANAGRCLQSPGWFGKAQKREI